NLPLSRKESIGSTVYWERRPTMARRSLGGCVAVVLALFIATTTAKAEMIVWSYQSGANPSNIILSTGQNVPTSSILLGGTPLTQEHDSANVLVVHMLTTGNQFNFDNATSSLGLSIKDGASSAQHMFSFPVAFNGTANLTTHASNVAVT